jgi:peptidyl-prolyl cis-trans isomerase C
MALLSNITVNGRVIPAATIATEAQNHPAPKGKPGHAWQAAARALAIRALMLDNARALGLVPAPRALEPGRIETDDEALVRQLLEAMVSPEPVDEGALAASYAAQPDRFRAPPLWEAAHILIPAAPGDARSRTGAKAIAQGLIAELTANPARFAARAAEHSVCESRSSGGFLGQVGPGDTVPEFEAALRRTPEGTIAPEPVETRYGFHVIRVDAHAEGAVLPYAAVAPRLRAAAEKAAWVRAARDFAQTLVAEAEVSGITLTAA